MKARTEGMVAFSISSTWACKRRLPAARSITTLGAVIPPRGLDSLLDLARAHETAQAGHQRLVLDAFLALGLDGYDRRRERVHAFEENIDRLALETPGALAKQLEHVLHRVRQLGDTGEAHRRAHPLEGVGDAEDQIDRLAVGWVLFDRDDGEVELLQVLARLGQEHRQVVANVHQRLR